MTRTPRRIGLLVLAVQGLVVGTWALLGPRSFHDDFPGLGMNWITGAYDEHLITDVGAGYLAFAAAAVLALAWDDVRLGRLTGAVWAVFSTPHFYFHLRHLDGLSSTEATLELLALGGTLLLAVLLALPERRPALSRRGVRR